MIFRRHCGGAFAKSRDLHDYPIPLAQDTQIHPHFDNCDRKFSGLSYITRRLCSLDSSPAHSMNTSKVMGVWTVETLGSQTPAKALSTGAKEPGRHKVIMAGRN